MAVAGIRLIVILQAKQARPCHIFIFYTLYFILLTLLDDQKYAVYLKAHFAEGFHEFMRMHLKFGPRPGGPSEHNFWTSRVNPIRNYIFGILRLRAIN